MEVTYDLSQFSQIGYLREYYSTIYNGNEYLLTHFHGAFEKFDKEIPEYLEIGGGPTIYQLISAGAKVRHITFSEFLDVNRKEVENWVENKNGAFNWDIFFRFVWELERKKDSTLTIKEMKERLRRKIKRVIPCNVLLDNPLDPLRMQNFDIIASNFCLESVTDKESVFLQVLENVTGLLRRGGTLIMSLVKNAHYYNIGDLNFPVLPVDEEKMGRYLAHMKYVDIQINTMPAEEGHGYHGMMFLTATKP
ncbi:MAG: hypothetical protein B6244_02825 [Candidatus Cloacimonetes bacterium 4572_55]|nr:MAG: hypothetical protein B6244_02825 [Candidatus Cloacimonetes bacterium 4572_55]